ncbi:hypothetical protein I3843_02G133200 [Carya illinoinensis]|uniref:MAPK kinase substrate protein n=1 Tax=Carya illinoinensis TaxID=32201 RepID=A0A8T1RFG8_CARIL|nr:uncharacterized protein At1g15400 [Carya illinoinensis]KAG2723058.1 hypothetical protein I3760_02G155300 [Carya illinoinensis]KAG6665344.1 hypothetical protein CIPAW_02G155200 [Carya illinoinensis]KAG6728017.1 hypothetical protein I3842_02G152500 [Carya illinoinensis]KAG7992546.1 hypothetical protein I3843_02G133200 [Carya illinoinensis]
MAGLQRSAVSFRRQGSSGFVFDDRFLSGQLNQVNQKEDPDQQELEKRLDTKEMDKTSRTEVGPTITIERSQSNGGARGYRTGKVAPAIEPPSPKLSACGFCAAFGQAGKRERITRKPAAKHRPRYT